MVKITFKNVGQGDSIILEWNSNEIIKFGIIDCNLFQNSNPVLDHLIAQDVKEIEFIILSHPHLDHFSGFFEFLTYCRNNNILIKKFLHTSLVTPDYLKIASRSIVAEKKLLRLFNLLKEMRQNEELNVYSIDANPDIKIPLDDEFILEILAPSAIEIDKYVEGVQYPFDEEEGPNNPNANWLATVLKIYNDNFSVILTSDVESSVLTRLGKRKYLRLGKDKIALAQIPHHGSKGNLNKTFWRMRKRNKITPVVISVGNNGYDHPSDDVLDFFNRLSNYQIERTDDIEISSKKVKKISAILNMVSRRERSKNWLGDKTFVLSNSNCVKV